MTGSELPADGRGRAFWFFAWSGGSSAAWWGVFFAQVTTKSSSFGVSLDGWPDWLVVLVGTVVVALALWLLIKALKWALWVLLFLVLLGGLEWAGWLLMR